MNRPSEKQAARTDLQQRRWNYYQRNGGARSTLSWGGAALPTDVARTASRSSTPAAKLQEP